MHARYIETDKSLLTGHNALLLRHIARDLLHASSQRHDNMTRPLVNQLVALVGAS